MAWYELSWQVIAWIIAVTLLAGYIQGLLGVGYPMLVTPPLALVALPPLFAGIRMRERADVAAYRRCLRLRCWLAASRGGGACQRLQSGFAFFLISHLICKDMP